MKNYRFLLPLLLVALMAAAWYMLISDSSSTAAEYDGYLETARSLAETGTTKAAVENYRSAIAIDPSPELYREVADYYRENGSTAQYLSWGEEFLAAYPTEPGPYECLVDGYIAEGDYTSCFDLLTVASKRGISSDQLKAYADELAYKYTFYYASYDDAGIFSSSFAPVKNKDRWGFVNRYGAQRVSCVFAEVGCFSASGYAPVVDEEGKPFFIDQAGDRALATNDEYVRFGLLAGDAFTAETPEGTFVYLDTSFKPVFDGEFDGATAFNDDLAAVKKDNSWYFINPEGQEAFSGTYEAVIIDEKGIAFRQERAFVSPAQGQYIMIDTDGDQVGSLTFEDARAFNAEGAAAVLMDGSWCFVDRDGELLSDKTYEGARSFANGLAAVKLDGKWGFVDAEENLVIEAAFEDARDFSEKGSVFIADEYGWRLLTLYRLNRD